MRPEGSSHGYGRRDGSRDPRPDNELPSGVRHVRPRMSRYASNGSQAASESHPSPASSSPLTSSHNPFYHQDRDRRDSSPPRHRVQPAASTSSTSSHRRQETATHWSYDYFNKFYATPMLSFIKASKEYLTTESRRLAGIENPGYILRQISTAAEKLGLIEHYALRQRAQQRELRERGRGGKSDLAIFSTISEVRDPEENFFACTIFVSLDEGHHLDEIKPLIEELRATTLRHSTRCDTSVIEAVMNDSGH